MVFVCVCVVASVFASAFASAFAHVCEVRTGCEGIIIVCEEV